MKRTMWQSGFLGALSGIIGGWSACFLVLALLLGPSQSVGLPREQSVLDMVISPEILMFYWLPTTIAGCSIGFVSGYHLVSRPKFLYQWPFWGLVGAVTAITPLFLIFFLLDGLEMVTDMMPSLYLVCIFSFLGGLVARFVYGMLQRRFLPELQMN